uniref:Pseudouridine synthase II N-terminal domain-containing protein n=1 Tax=Panagrolaimus sp. JU765 TaxID=591449 RepID=A0AC34QN36_9BILA
MKVKLDVKDIWQLLNGVLCVYKPRDVSLETLKKRIIQRIVEDGNKYDDSVVPMIKMPIVEPHPISQASVVVGFREQLDYSRHPLMVGKAFRPEDVMLEELKDAETSSSGLCIFGIGPQCYEMEELKQKAWINAYRLEGKFGEESEQHKIRGKISTTAEWQHVTRHKLDKLLSRVKAMYKRMSFKLAEVDLQSQEAFEIARRGAPRPKILDSPVVYDIKVTNFQTPHFGLEVQISGETDYFLRAFIHEIGLSLGTTARPRKLRRMRIGPFGLNHALLDKELQLENILKNILMCNKIMKIAEANEQERVVKKKKVVELESNALIGEFYLDEKVVTEEEDCLKIPWGREYTKL